MVWMHGGNQLQAAVIILMCAAVATVLYRETRWVSRLHVPVWHQEETVERDKLRRIYIDSVKLSLTSQLDNAYIVEADGTKTKVTRKS